MRALLQVLILLSAQAAWAQSDGEALFISRCAGCHGPSGQGDGPMATLITLPVADLTQLATRNEGEFPLIDVVRVIDGRADLRGHGGAPMPVFGTILGGGSAVLDLPGGGVLETRGDVLAIAEYLRELQVE